MSTSPRECTSQRLRVKAAAPARRRSHSLRRHHLLLLGWRHEYLESVAFGERMAPLVHQPVMEEADEDLVIEAG
jgi:hypothetical protein